MIWLGKGSRERWHHCSLGDMQRARRPGFRKDARKSWLCHRHTSCYAGPAALRLERDGMGNGVGIGQAALWAEVFKR